MKTLSIHSVRNVLALVIIGGLGYMAYLVSPSSVAVPKVEAGTAQNVSGWGWSENIGWVSLNDTNEITPYLGAPYGVNVDVTNKATGGVGLFTGKAWSENIGWINFDAADVTGCPTAPCQAQVDWSTGKVTGWAHAYNGSATSGWDGWIKFAKGAADTGPAYGVTISGNKFAGYAWGSDVVGWIDFGPTVGGVPIGGQVAAPPCTASDVPAGSWGTCQPINQCPTASTAGVQVGACPTGGTVTRSCDGTQVCGAGSTAPAGSKTHWWQF